VQWPWRKQPKEETHTGNLNVSVRPGVPRVIVIRNAAGPFEICFEDDGETGYVYACDRTDVDLIQDAVLIYQNAPKKPTELSVKWCRSKPRVAVSVNGIVQAVAAFDEHRIWCRSGFPPGGMKWTEHPHTWTEDALAGF
jgi:hypothetical protein